VSNKFRANKKHLAVMNAKKGTIKAESRAAIEAAHSADSDDRIAALHRLVRAADKATYALRNLHALVIGECPSLLEDDHHDGMARDALAAYDLLRSEIGEIGNE
jgi:hypothetical protein